MKKRTSNFILSVFILIAGDYLYFLCQPYPKSIIKSLGNAYAAQDVIANFVYFVLFLSVLVFMTAVIVSPGRRNVLSFKSFIKKFILLFIIQAGVDCVQFAGARLFPSFSMVVSNGCSVFCWCLFAAVLMPNEKTDKKTETDLRRIWHILGTVALLILVCSVLLEFIAFSVKQSLYEKYSPDSQILNERIRNIVFRSEIRNLLVDISCGITFLFGIRKYGNLSEKGNNEKLPRNTGIVVVRMILLTNMLAVLFLIKLALCPNGTVPIGGIGPGGGHRTTYREVEGIYDMTEATVWGVARLNGDSEEAKVYVITKETVWYDGIARFKFKTDGHYAGWSGKEADDEFLNNGWQSFTHGTENIAIFAGQEIVWTENGEVYHIPLKKLPSYKENAILLDLCRMRIDFGDWRFFEYGCEYLLKYDKGFITPYIERYAQGDYSQFELDYSKDYNPGYIQAFAADMIKEHMTP